MSRTFIIPHPLTGEPTEREVPTMLVRWATLATEGEKQLGGLEILVAMVDQDGNGHMVSLEEAVCRMRFYHDVLEQLLDEARTDLADLKAKIQHGLVEEDDEEEMEDGDQF
jgi:hypothetical protein